MTVAADIWKESNYFRRDAELGSRKLLIALLRMQGLYPAEQQSRCRKYKRGTSGLFERNAKVAKFEIPVADFYGLHPGKLHEATRRRRIAHPRQVVMYLAHTYGRASLPEIGRHFGKDHTTALHACRMVQSKPWLMDAATAILEGLAANDAKRSAVNPVIYEERKRA